MILPMSFWFLSPRRIYLDNAAATPLIPAARVAMQPWLTKSYGNASAIHEEGKAARSAVEAAREKIARVLEVKSGSVFFTGSGTESNNLAILGYLKQCHFEGRAYSDMEVLTTPIEHPSIMALIPELESLGVVVKQVSVTDVGSVTKTALMNVLSPKTVLVTFAYSNSEVGVVQPVHQLVRLIREHEKVHGTHVQIHLDAAQAPLYLPCSFSPLGVDSIALDAGKCGGPKGVGILGLRERERLTSISYGGGQEGGLRPGTENVAGIVGAAVAISAAAAGQAKRAIAVAAVRDAGLQYMAERLPQAVVNGPVGAERLANNINISLPGFDTEYAVVWLDKHGVAASTKSACAGAGGGKSHVVLALTHDEARASSTIRLSLNEATTVKELKRAIDILAAYCLKMKGLTK
jgi:cysteine desulfurase